MGLAPEASLAGAVLAGPCHPALGARVMGRALLMTVRDLAAVRLGGRTLERLEAPALPAGVFLGAQQRTAPGLGRSGPWAGQRPLRRGPCPAALAPVVVAGLPYFFSLWFSSLNGVGIKFFGMRRRQYRRGYNLFPEYDEKAERKMVRHVPRAQALCPCGCRIPACQAAFH